MNKKPNGQLSSTKKTVPNQSMSALQQKKDNISNSQTFQQRNQEGSHET